MDTNFTITPYLMLDGQAQAAITYYQTHLHAEILGLELLKDWPGELGTTVTPELENRIMHAHLRIGQSEIMIADYLPDQTSRPGSTVNLMIDVPDAALAEQLYNLLQDGGTVLMPLQDTGFSPAYAQLVDRFGIEWQIVAAHPELG